MSFMFEVYCRGDLDPSEEEQISREASLFGGRLDFRETSGVDSHGLCLTFEFSDLESAEKAASCLRLQGRHVEGPGEYGDV